MKLLVIDGNSIVNRAFYGIRLLTNKQGQFTNGIYGFLNILIKLREECSPDSVAIAFDLKAPTFRHKMYSEYKAGRKGMPEELRSQMPILKELLVSLGYTIVEKEGYEADDILGTLSAQCKGEDLCFIATGDRDSLQLVSDNTRVLLASTKMGKAVTTVYDKAKIFEEYAVEPSGMIEIKALMGDSSDNIPGVAGIGQKTAGELISKYKTIDYIYENLDTLEIKKGVYEKLKAGKDSAYLSKELGTICLEAPVDLTLESYLIKAPDSRKAISTLVSLDMYGMIEKLGLTAEKTEEPEEQHSAEKRTFTEHRDLPGLLGIIRNEGEVYFVTRFGEKGIDSFTFYLKDKILYAPKDAIGFDEFTQTFLSGDSIKHSCETKRLYKFAAENGITLRGLRSDTEIAAYILNPSANSYDLQRLTQEYGTELELECDEQYREIANQCPCFRELSQKLMSLLEENSQLKLFEEIEMPLVKVLANMELEGFRVDREGIEDFGQQMAVKAQQLTEKIYEKAGQEFNINSPKQLGKVLFEDLAIPCKKKTKSGYSTNAEVLEELSDEYPIVADILEYRAISKLKSTYCEGLVKVIDSDGRIRSTLNQTETRTGRISSTEPNLQNIPIRSELGSQMRKFFIADEGKVLVDADYSQIELRVLAHLSSDKTMLEAFNNGEDIHTITASQVFNMPVLMVTPLMRSRAKAVNFGIIYGIGAFSLAKDIGVTRKEADNYIKGYLHHYSGIRAYLEKTVEKAREDGFVSTMFERRRYLPELTASNKMLQAFGERVAKNMPVQGSAADIIKIAMIRVSERLEREKLDARLIMQVHDELIVECSEKDRGAVEIVLKQEMENACRMKVKLLADVHWGKTWHEAKS